MLFVLETKIGLDGTNLVIKDFCVISLENYLNLAKLSVPPSSSIMKSQLNPGLFTGNRENDYKARL